VTHNYEREHEFNVWFTLIAKSRDEITDIIEKLRVGTGADEMIELPATHTFKIDAAMKYSNG
jgi:siroheme decarboxylase